MAYLPSRRLILILVVPVLLSFLCLFDKSLLAGTILFHVFLLLLALLDAVISLRKLVSVERKAPKVLSLGRANRLELLVRSQAKRRLQIQVQEGLFESVKSSNLPLTCQLEARASATCSFYLEPLRRGTEQLGAHYVRYPSVLGLWIRQYEIPDQQEVRIYPDLQQLRVYELLARQNRELAWMRSTRFKGGESEFARLREYTKDDEFRAIDWKATARRQKLISREYQLESNQNIYFMLDSGRMMTAEVEGLSQFDHALNSALMLAHIAIKNGDQVGLMSFDSMLHAQVAPLGGPSATARIIQAVYDLEPRLVETDFELAFSRVGRYQKKRALVILLTQLLDMNSAKPLLLGLRSLTKQHLPLVVLFRDLDTEKLLEDRSPSELSLYTRGAAAELLRARQKLVKSLERTGTLVLEAAPKSLTSSLIGSYLDIKARHLL